MNNSSVFGACTTAYTGTEHARSIVAHTFSGLSILIILLNFISNISVIFSLLSTALLKTPSMKLIFYMSCADLCIAVFGQTTFITVILGTETSCNFKCISEFFIQFFGHISAYIIGLIGYDRYFRIEYLNRYSKFISMCKLNIGLSVGISMAFVQSLMLTMGAQFDIFELMTIIYLSIDMVMFLVILLPYALSIIVVRNHRKEASNRDLLKQVDHIVTATASRIMIAVVILYTPYIVFIFPRVALPTDSAIRKEEWFNVCIFIGFICIQTNSFVNGLIFLSYNTKCREKVLVAINKAFSCCLKRGHNGPSVQAIEMI